MPGLEDSYLCDLCLGEFGDDFVGGLGLEVSEDYLGELVQGFDGGAVELNVDLLEGLQKLGSSGEANHVFEDDGQDLGVGFGLGELEVHLKRLQESKGEGVFGLDELADLGEAVVG